MNKLLKTTLFFLFLARAGWSFSLDLMGIEAPPPTYTHPAGDGEIMVYEPGSSEQIALFEKAADELSLPAAWAHSAALQNILKKEGSTVGQPNYTYSRGSLARELGAYGNLARPRNAHLWPKVWESLVKGEIRANSTACGLGQLVNYNVDQFLNQYHRLGLADLTIKGNKQKKGVQEKLAPYRKEYYGNALMEACGMLWYLKRRYGTPERAWQLYNKGSEGY